MKRVLVLVAAFGLILPAAAQAATFGGVVIAKNAKIRVPGAKIGLGKIGLGRRTRVRGSVVKRSGRTLYLSAGRSVVPLELRGSTGVKLHAGDRVDATASVGRASLFCDDVTPVGHDDQIDLEGIYLSNEDSTLSLAFTAAASSR
jgi:hypothetical protein